MSGSVTSLAAIDPAGSTSAAAAIALSERLQTLERRMAAVLDCRAEQPEAIHQLRVAARRSAAGVRLFRRWIPKRKRRRWRKRLRDLRRAAGTIRDLDVFLASPTTMDRDCESARSSGGRTEADSADDICARVAAQRAEAASDLLETVSQLAPRRAWRRQVRRLLRRLDRGTDGDDAPAFRDWAARRVGKLSRRLLRAVPSDLSDLGSLHRLRVCGKQLRYGLELLAAALPAGPVSDLQERLEWLQEALGGIQDRAVAADRFREWAEAEDDAAQQAQFLRHEAEERRRLGELLREFQVRWTEAELRRWRELVAAVSTPCGIDVASKAPPQSTP